MKFSSYQPRLSRPDPEWIALAHRLNNTTTNSFLTQHNRRLAAYPQRVVQSGLGLEGPHPGVRKHAPQDDGEAGPLRLQEAGSSDDHLTIWNGLVLAADLSLQRFALHRIRNAAPRHRLKPRATTAPIASTTQNGALCHYPWSSCQAHGGQLRSQLLFSPNTTSTNFLRRNHGTPMPSTSNLPCLLAGRDEGRQLGLSGSSLQPGHSPCPAWERDGYGIGWTGAGYHAKRNPRKFYAGMCGGVWPFGALNRPIELFPAGAGRHRAQSSRLRRIKVLVGLAAATRASVIISDTRAAEKQRERRARGGQKDWVVLSRREGFFLRNAPKSNPVSPPLRTSPLTSVFRGGALARCIITPFGCGREAAMWPPSPSGSSALVGMRGEPLTPFVGP